LEYVSSAGLRVLLKSQKQMNAQGSMKVIGVNESIMEVFEITGFADILTIE
jgi:anti-sigma B factor antagonist